MSDKATGPMWVMIEERIVIDDYVNGGSRSKILEDLRPSRHKLGT